MLTHEENELLCRVEGDATMGQIMRRHWLPACLVEEVPEADGNPVRVRILGEDLVAFRDSEGRVGLLDEYCPHRRASLVYGRNEECGLRCLYHGWKMDVDGNVMDMPSEPTGSALAQKVKHKSYPVREANGLIWVYMGPPSLMPEFERPGFANGSKAKVSIVKVHVGCNWAQVLEGAIDSAHSSSLHSTDIRPARVAGAGMTDAYMTRPSTDKSPRIQVQHTDYGMSYVAIRRPITNADTHNYLRITNFIAPITVQIPPNSQYSLIQYTVPIDDVNTFLYFIAWSDDTTPGTGIDQESWRKFCGAQVGIDLDEKFHRVRSRDNNYLQDRQAMKLGNFTGLRGIPNQDIAMWETMGKIANRSDDRLGASDIAIVEFRRIMVEAAKAMRDGHPAIGTSGRSTPFADIRSYEGITEKETDWRSLITGLPLKHGKETGSTA
ncbi:MAG: Rieske 2Fe-2S domain-containing protein [Burkholderiaceae bacterium]